jgi:hypothetical protein
MLKVTRNSLLSVFVLCFIFLSACSEQSDKPPAPQLKVDTSSVADDVLFLVLGKMSLYDQNANGEITLRNHHFVAEIMPKKGRKVIGGTLTSALDSSKILNFNSEGIAFLAHGERVLDPDKLHEIHPDGAYLFDYETESGVMTDQRVVLTKRPTIDNMPGAEKVNVTQNDENVPFSSINPDQDLHLSWEAMPGNTKVEKSDLADLIFVLGFNCKGENIAHSGRPYQGGKYLTYKDSEFVIPANSLNSGMNYTVIVEQATADVEVYNGVPAIATYATLTFIKLQTTGEAVSDEQCPGSND